MSEKGLIYLVSIGVVIAWFLFSNAVMDYASTEPPFHKWFFPLINVASIFLGGILYQTLTQEKE